MRIADASLSNPCAASPKSAGHANVASHSAKLALSLFLNWSLLYESHDMTTPLITPAKPATTTEPILDCLAERWSPRAFQDKPVEPEKIVQLFEAARWAASAFNEQPWRFILATKEDRAGFDKALGCLVEANQTWAKAAPVLCLTLTASNFVKNGKPNRVALHDLGLAMGNLSAQATALGLAVHQMAGVNLSQVRSAYQVPESFEPQTAFVVGYAGEADLLEDDGLKEAEKQPRERKAIGEIVFDSEWEKPSGVVSK